MKMLDKIQSQGYEAHKEGKRLVENPYLGTKDAWKWKEGWNKAREVSGLKSLLEDEDGRNISD